MAKVKEKAVVPEVSPGVEQYKRSVREYNQVLMTLDQLQKRKTALETQGINLEGQLKALREAFGFEHEAMAKEVSIEDAAKK